MRRLLAALCFVAVAGCGSNMGSIGAMLGKSHADGRLVVKDTPQGMEAAKAGLQPGDEILTIDGRDARRMKAEEVHEALVGPVDSPVDLTVLRGDEVIRLRVRRGPLK
jgi:C-terminal processing protease CtpA/Prc